MADLSPCSQGLGRSAVEDRGMFSFLYSTHYLISPAWGAKWQLLLAPSDLPPPILSSRSTRRCITAYAGGLSKVTYRFSAAN